MESSRRDLLKLGAAITGMTAAMAAGVNILHAADATGERRGDMIYRKLGRTGESVSLVGLGGFHIGSVDDEAEAIKIIRTAIDRGITFMDNCWDYHDGKSEIVMGKALRDGGYRDKVFLMTKTDGRDKKTCAKQLDECLQRLGTDRIDLVQHHEIIRFEDPEKIYRDGGANEALLDAQKAGKIRFIGFTGHKDPKMHLNMLETARKHGHRPDTVQMPLNILDAHYKSFEKLVLPELVKDEIGVLAMKTLGSGYVLKTNKASAIECLHYAMNLPTSVVITGIDSMKILDQAIEAVKTFKPLTADQITALLERTKDVAADGKFEPFKTTKMFDGTANNPHWLG
jgi:aryl-alcohol dehydrogenase-like predicted oxidoreductase